MPNYVNTSITCIGSLQYVINFHYYLFVNTQTQQQKHTQQKKQYKHTQQQTTTQHNTTTTNNTTHKHN